MAAEEERRAICERTKAALAAAKARGVKLGGPVENLKNAELGRQKAAEARVEGNCLATDASEPRIPRHRGWRVRRSWYRCNFIGIRAGQECRALELP
jgi:DNA invertase Pin-like site-specific DNA recombinase